MLRAGAISFHLRELLIVTNSVLDKAVLGWEENNFNEIVTAQRAGPDNVRLSEWKGFTLLTRKDLCPRVGA